MYVKNCDEMTSAVYKHYIMLCSIMVIGLGCFIWLYVVLRYCIGRDKLKDGNRENSERIRRNKINRKLGDKVRK